MDEEVKFLRTALTDVQTALWILWNQPWVRKTAVPTFLREMIIQAAAQASEALEATSGALPPGYSLDERDVASGRIYARKDGQSIPKIGSEYPHSFTEEFEARLFCWTHHELTKEEGGITASMSGREGANDGNPRSDARRL